jgi:hypothetical protein
MKAPCSLLTDVLALQQQNGSSLRSHDHLAQCGMYFGLLQRRTRTMTLQSQPCRQLAYRGQAMYINAGVSFEEAKFAIGAVVASVTATSLGAGYMLASQSELETMHDAFEQYFDAV